MIRQATTEEVQSDILTHNNWPPSLIKAVIDCPFDYAIGLRCGSVIYFKEARPSTNHKWVVIDDIEKIIGPAARMTDDCMQPATYPRGIDVRVKDIMWCADAPFGS